MATTTNYAWETPDDTDLVKDGASAIRTLGSSIDTTTKALNPSTTLGDIEYRSSTANTNTRLGIGTTGQVLTVASGVPAWATPAAGGATNYNLISTTSMSGSSSVTVSSIGGYDNYHIVILDVKWSGQNQANYRLNGDSGANYMNAMAQSTFPSSYASSQGAVESSSGATEVLISQNSQNSNSKWVGVIDIRGAASTTKHKMINHMGAADAASSYGQGHYSGGAVWKNTDALTSFTIYSYYAFTAGTIYVYGA